jgi:hypothetical protein
MTTKVDTLGGLSWVVAGLGTLSMHTPLKQHANQHGWPPVTCQ